MSRQPFLELALSLAWARIGFNSLASPIPQTRQRRPDAGTARVRTPSIPRKPGGFRPSPWKERHASAAKAVVKRGWPFFEAPKELVSVSISGNVTVPVF